MQFYLLAWQRGFDFSGRSSRQAFWYFLLVHCLITLGCIALDITMQTWFDTVYSILSFIPMLAAIIRRLHDTNKSGYWAWVFLIPAIGPLLLLYLLAQPSNKHSIKEALA